MPEMTSYERVTAALDRRVPDRVPYFEFVFDARVMEGMLPGSTYFEFIDHFEVDVVGLNRSSWPKEGLDWIDEEKGIFRDHWGVIRAMGPESSPYPIEGPIKSEDDLKHYTPPDPDNPALLAGLDEVVKRYKGKKPIAWVGRDAYFNPAHLRGVENFLMDMALNPKFVHGVIEACQSFDLPLIEKAVKAGVDIVLLGDDYADKNAPFMSPKHFEELILPGLKKAVQTAHDAGAYVVKHTDGNIMPIIDMIVDTGIDALNPIEPAAGMDIGEVKRKYGDRICIVGNVDCGPLLSWGTPEEVRDAVKECIRTAAPGGGYMLSSSNSIHSSVDPDNCRVMGEACLEYGEYDMATGKLRHPAFN